MHVISNTFPAIGCLHILILIFVVYIGQSSFTSKHPLLTQSKPHPEIPVSQPLSHIIQILSYKYF